jgi:hypothetical protein
MMGPALMLAVTGPVTIARPSILAGSFTLAGPSVLAGPVALARLTVLAGSVTLAGAVGLLRTVLARRIAGLPVRWSVRPMASSMAAVRPFLARPFTGFASSLGASLRSTL